MIDLGSGIAVGLAGFLAGTAWANRGHLQSVREAAQAGALVVNGRAYLTTPLHLTPISPEPPRHDFKPKIVSGEAS